MKTLTRIVEMLQKVGRRGGARHARPETPQIDTAQLVQMIRNTDLFSNLPEENLVTMAEMMEPVAMTPGSTIIRQGDEGDFYYVLLKGSARVTREGQGAQGVENLAELSEGSAFGEEALISNAKRNATVTMSTAGTVLRISKTDFNDNVREPLLDWVSPTEAQRKIREGAKWLDVRDEDGGGASRLSGAIICPMDELRDKMSELDTDGLYCCYCRNGRLSATAAFLLGQKGFKVVVMRGGLQGLERAGLI